MTLLAATATHGFHRVGHMLVAIAGLTLITFATRASFFLAPERVRIPTAVERMLRYAPACALTAIVAPAVFTRNHHAFIITAQRRMITAAERSIFAIDNTKFGRKALSLTAAFDPRITVVTDVTPGPAVTQAIAAHGALDCAEDANDATALSVN